MSMADHICTAEPCLVSSTAIHLLFLGLEAISTSSENLPAS
ncbi:MAG: hypothetical protein QXT66_04825 [Nitrososphaerota archaeon]